MNRQQFMDFFRSDKYSEDLTIDDKVEIFLSALAGSSDVTKKILEQLLEDYDVEGISILGDNAENYTGTEEKEERLLMTRMIALVGKYGDSINVNIGWSQGENFICSKVYTTREAFTTEYVNGEYKNSVESLE